jgi:catechol 2,3-dioxygenase-like lactoylglutathione lyase family enzyme
VDFQIQVITLSVSDVDQAADFYTRRAGFTLDVDYRPAPGFRVVQLTPPGSACSVQLGAGLTGAPPGSARGTFLAVADIEAARAELTARGVRSARSGTSHPSRPGQARKQPAKRPRPPPARERPAPVRPVTAAAAMPLSHRSLVGRRASAKSGRPTGSHVGNRR